MSDKWGIIFFPLPPLKVIGSYLVKKYLLQLEDFWLPFSWLYLYKWCQWAPSKLETMRQNCWLHIWYKIGDVFYAFFCVFDCYKHDHWGYLTNFLLNDLKELKDQLIKTFWLTNNFTEYILGSKIWATQVLYMFLAVG